MKFVSYLLWSLSSFPTAGLAWVLMWVTDRLYEGSGWFLAVPIRIVIFLMQIGILFGCLTTAISIAGVTFVIFRMAVKGQDVDEGRLSVKNYMLLLVIPVAMNISSLLIGLFHEWLNFNEHGLGFITLGYVGLVWYLQAGGLIVFLVWLVILPIFLRNRRSHPQDKGAL